MVQEKETIEVLYALMDKSGKYSKFAGTSICSLFENTKSKVRVHIFHDGSIKGENRKNFEILAKKYAQEVIFYNVRKLQADVLKEAEKIMEKAVSDNRYTEAALYRLLAPQILPETIGRLIYLDADTLVNMDITKLWKEQIGPGGMAVVHERDMLDHYKLRALNVKPEIEKLNAYFESLGVKLEDGFNSGVILMDLNKIRPMGNILLSGLKIMAASDADNNFYDQNILNFYFGTKTYRLPWHYNILMHWDKERRPSRNIVGIYHYMGHTLTMNEDDLRDTIFFDYFAKTPWMKGEIICHIFGELEKIYLRYMEKRFRYMRHIVANIGAKKLVIGATLGKEDKVLELLKEPDIFDLQATYPREFKLPTYFQNPEDNKASEEQPLQKKKRPRFPDNIIYFDLGDDKNPNLNLPYDVDEYYYLFFSKDYLRIKMMLEEAGLPEEGHYMDGNFLIEDIIEGGAINPNKFAEQL